MVRSPEAIRSAANVTKKAQQTPTPNETTIAPEFQRLLSSPLSPGSYGCPREIFHPLSPKAEPTAILFYDEDESESDGEFPPPSSSPLNTRGPGRRQPFSPQRPSGLSRSYGPDGTLDGEIGRLDNITNQPVDRASQFTDDSPTVKRTGLRQTLSSRAISPLKRDGQKTDFGSVPPVTPNHGRRHSVQVKVEDSPVPNINPKSTPVNDPQDPTKFNPTTPRQGYGFYYTDSSSEEASLKANSYDDDLSYPPITPPGKRVNHAAEEMNFVVNQMKVLHIKAQVYSESVTIQPTDKHTQKALADIYNSPDRFNINNPDDGEDRFQAKIRSTVEKEERRQAELAEAERRRKAEEEALRRAEEERKTAEEAARLAKIKAEEEKKRAAEAERLKSEQEKADAERKRKETEEAEKAKQQADQAAAAKKQADAAQAAALQKQQQDRAAQTAQQAAAAAVATPAPAAASAPSTNVLGQPANPNEPGRVNLTDENAHCDRILANLKQLKAAAESTANREYMKHYNVNNIVRDLRPRLAQLTSEKAQIMKIRDMIRTNVGSLKSVQGPMVQIRDYVFSPCKNPADMEGQVPLAFIYLVNEVAKMMVKQVTTEGASRVSAIDPVGVVIASAFAHPATMYNTKSFLDIFIVRLFKNNPILRGVTGPEVTDQDRLRLGWKQDDGKWEREDDHINRVAGQCAGWASLACRDFRKSAMDSPLPMFNLWNKLAMLLNTPPGLLTNTHYSAVKMMLEVCVGKLIKTYGPQGLRLMQLILGPWAEKGIENGYSGAIGMNAFKKTLQAAQ